MTDKKNPSPYEIQELSPRLGNKLRFAVWLERYDINMSKLADEMGISRQYLYDLKHERKNCSLAIALCIFYMSGGLVSMFSLLKDGEALEQDLRPWIRDTNTLNRSKISRGNQLTRYHLRRL